MESNLTAEDFKLRLIRLEEFIKIQCSNGTWDYDPYMHGLANGLLMAASALCGIEPRFLEAPKVWGRDKKLPENRPGTTSDEVDRS